MVLCFGELLLRLSPDAKGEWIDDRALKVYTGGSELNVATALAQWRIPVSYVTAVPDNFLAAQLINKIKSQNIDVSCTIHNGNKIGLYYLLQGNDIQHSEVIYDRFASSFATLQPGIINWDNVLNGIRWFHFSAISPALSESAAMVCKEALQACVKKNIFISADLNYRAKLWQYGKAATEVMPELVAYCDLLMGNIWSAESMLGIKTDEHINSVNTKEQYVQQSKKTSEAITKQFPKCRIVAHTFRFDKMEINYYGTIYNNNNLYVSSTYSTKQITDKVGSGDCFMAGLIYSLYNHLPFQQVINFATAAGFQKLFVEGDSINKSVQEIKTFIQQYV